jgi:hypothetical protein
LLPLCARLQLLHARVLSHSVANPAGLVPRARPQQPQAFAAPVGGGLPLRVCLLLLRLLLARSRRLLLARGWRRAVGCFAVCCGAAPTLVLFWVMLVLAWAWPITRASSNRQTAPTTRTRNNQEHGRVCTTYRTTSALVHDGKMALGPFLWRHCPPLTHHSHPPNTA